MNELENSRTTALKNLIALRAPVGEAIQALREFPWDSEQELVQLTSAATLSILHRFIEGELSAADIQEWADALEVRDDVGLEAANEEGLRELIFEIATPELSEPFTVAVAQHWQSRLMSNSSAHADGQPNVKR
jgi:hypothetical protein